MDRVPLEILAHILKKAGESRMPVDRAAWQKWQTALRHASLVARRWRQPAQKELWGTLRTTSSDEWEALLNSPAFGCYRPLFIFLCRLSAMQTVLLFAQCMGVENLHLRRIEALGSDLLSLPSLSGMRAIRLFRGVELTRTSSASVFPALHTLTVDRCSLDLSDQSRLKASSSSINSQLLFADDDILHYPPALAQTLFPLATLTTLCLPDEGLVPDYAAYFPLLSDSLKRLQVGIYASIPPFLDALAQLRALRSLDYRGMASTLPLVAKAFSRCTEPPCPLETVHGSSRGLKLDPLLTRATSNGAALSIEPCSQGERQE